MLLSSLIYLHLRYSSRSNAGEVLATLNMCEISDEAINWKGCKTKIEISPANPQNWLDKSYGYMFQKISDRIEGNSLKHDNSKIFTTRILCEFVKR